MPTARFGCVAVTIDDRVYVVGGGVTACGRTGALEVFDPVTQTWSSRQPLPTISVSLAAAVLGGRLYAMGGAGAGATHREVEVYDPVTNTWQTKAPMPIALGSTSAAAAGGRIYVVGGAYQQGAEGTTQAYDPCTDTWVVAPSMPTARAECTTAAIGDVVYAFGGNAGSILGTVEAFTPAFVMAAGSGCSGGGPRPLAIGTNGNPRVPNPTFALAIGGGPTGAPTAVLLALDLSPFPLPIGGGCFVHLNPLTMAVALSATPPAMPLPIPPLAALVGSHLALQAAAVNPITLALATSNALTLGLGQ